MKNESASALADLGFQGVLDEGTMGKIAKAVTVNMLDGLSPGFLAPCIGGSTSRLHYSTADGKDMRFNVPDYPRGTSFYWQARGFALLEPFDDGDKIRQRSALTHGQAQVWPMPAVGVLLGVSP